MTIAAPRLRTSTCKRCGLDWQQPIARGPAPGTCATCKALPRPRKVRRVRESPGLALALSVTTYRLAIEEATSALRLGRVADALAALERVEAPTRSAGLNKNNVVIELPA